MNKATQRVITGLIMAVILIPIVYLGSWPLTLLASVLAYFAGYEFVKAYLNHYPTNELSWIKFVFPLDLSFLVFIGCLFPNALIPATLICTLGLALLLLVIPYENIRIVYFLAFIMQYVGLGLGSLISLRYVEHASFDYLNRELGLYLFALVLIITFLTDIGAYTIGRHFGKRRLVPNISPNKTIAGAIGGLVFGVVFGLGFYYVISSLANQELIYVLGKISPIGKGIILTIIFALISSAGQLGDLVTSKIKRHFGIKDYGNLFPGHGGVMDRFDSLIFSGIMFYLIYYLIGILS